MSRCLKRLGGIFLVLVALVAFTAATSSLFTHTIHAESSAAHRSCQFCHLVAVVGPELPTLGHMQPVVCVGWLPARDGSEPTAEPFLPTGHSRAPPA